MPRTPLDILAAQIDALELAGVETVTRREMLTALEAEGTRANYAANAVAPGTAGGAVRRLLECGRLLALGNASYRISEAVEPLRRVRATAAPKDGTGGAGKRPGNHKRVFEGNAPGEDWAPLTTFTLGDVRWNVSSKPFGDDTGKTNLKLWAEGRTAAKANFWVTLGEEGQLEGRDADKMREHREGMEEALFAALDLVSGQPDPAAGAETESDEAWGARRAALAQGVVAELQHEGKWRLPLADFIGRLERTGLIGAKRWARLNPEGPGYRVSGDVVEINSTEALDDVNDLV